MAKQKYYAVKSGREKGIFKTWQDCQKQTNGYPGSKFKSFDTIREAEEYMNAEVCVDNQNKSEEDAALFYVSGVYQEETKISAHAILMCLEEKSRIEYGRTLDCEEEVKTFSGEIIAVINAVEIAYELKDKFKKAIIYHKSDEIRRLCVGELEPKTNIGKKLLETYQNCTRVLPVEFKSNQTSEQLEQADVIAKYAIDNDVPSIIKSVPYHECNSHTLVGLENIKRLNISSKECIGIIDGICKDLHIEMCIKSGTDVDTDKHIIINLNKNYLSSEIHAHTTKDGLTLDVLRGRNLELNYLIINELYSKHNIGTVEEKKYSYDNLSTEQLKNASDNLLLFKEDPNYEFIENQKANNMKYSITIKYKKSNEKVSVYIYTNNKLEIRGIKYLLWEDVCYIIEKSIGVTLHDIIGRMNVGTDLKFQIDSVDVCDEDLRKELGHELAAFLYTYDYDVILSVKCSFDAKVRVPDYGIYIDPLTRALEGYLKKMLLHLKIVDTEMEINSSKWNFNCVFEFSNELKNDLHSKLSSDIIIKDKQLKILSKMCFLMWNLRNKINHSGPKGTITYNNYELGLLKYNEIMNLIKESFQLLF